jgi:signal transduction histidine kinase/CheY-like chemotaxis protein
MTNSGRTALVGFAGGCVVVVATLAAEAMASGLPLRGGLLELQRTSVAVWVVESLPILLALAGWRAGAREIAPASAPALLPPPPVAAPLSASTPVPPPVPESLQSANLFGKAGTDARIRALQELVKVLRDQVEHATAENRARSGYLATLGPQIRTPLTSIIGYAEMLHEEATASGGRLGDDLHQMSGAARELMDRIGDLLDLSKIEVGQLAVVLEDVDVAQILEEVRSGLKKPVAVRMGPGTRLVRADHMRTRQILTTLLGHAFTLGDESTVTVHVERTSHRPDAWIALRVRSTAATLAPREIETLFTAWRTMTPDTRSLPTGLGLAVSRRLAELMGGRIEVDVGSSDGTTFSLVLPPARTAEEQVAPRSTVPLNERLAGLSLLMADPSPGGLALARYLERAGLVVEVVSDVPSAQIATRARDRDMVVLDADLHDAWGFAEHLVKAEVPVVIVSRRDEDVEQALELGVTAFLVQPVERRLVLATLERCL